MNNAIPLRLALLSNAAFSLACALLMLIRPDLVGQWLGVQAPLVLRIVGAGLVIFAADLVHQASRKRMATWRALITCTEDLMWVAATAVLLALFPDVLSGNGTLLVIDVAAAVFLLCCWQLWGIARAHRAAAPGEYRHCVVVEVNAPAEAMWKVVSDFGGIKNYMPLLKHSEVLDGRKPGLGAVRFCEDHGGRKWSEECTAYSEGRSLSIRFRTEAPDFPFPFRQMRGGWEVLPSMRGAQVTVWWEFAPRHRLLAPVIMAVFAWQLDREFHKIVARMAVAARGELGARQGRPGVVSRVLPLAC